MVPSSEPACTLSAQGMPISLVATGLPLVLATWLYFGLFDKSEAGLQLIERVPWIAPQ